jgi:multidrug efflux pump subunit AcrB
MVILLFGGFLQLTSMQKEVFPDFTFDAITVSVSFPGSTPEDSEQGIVLAIEEAVRGLESVVEINSTARQGGATVMIEYERGTNEQKFYQEVQQAIDRIRTFPEDAEEPRISLASRRREVIDVVIYGDASEHVLRNIAEEARFVLLSHPSISQIDYQTSKNLEVHIQPSLEDLRRYGLSFQDISRRVSQTSVEIPGGSVRTQGGEILVRFDERKDFAKEFAQIPILTTPSGAIVRLEDVAKVDEAFEDTIQLDFYEGQAAMGLEIYRVGEQTPLEVTTAVREVMADFESSLPAGINFAIRNDRSEIYQQRQNLLLKNGAIGLCLVLFLLGIFLEPRLAFWVTMGIPISFLGAFVFLPEMGVTLNMISMFAFLIALGIVVDDAIVVGENIYENRQNGMPPMQAAIAGVRQVAVPVTFSILTNIVAFLPLYFVPGFVGKIWKVIPLVVGTVFIVSLIEALAILPAHLGHLKDKPDRGFMKTVHGFQQRVSHLLRNLIYNFYGPFLDWCMRHRYLVTSASVAILLVSLAYAMSGRLGMTLFPSVDSDYTYVSARLPLGSPESLIYEVKDQIDAAAKRVVAQNGGDQLSEGIFTQVQGDNISSRIYLTPPGVRPIENQEVAQLWREELGPVPAAEAMRFQSNRGGPGGRGSDLTIELAHSDVRVLEQASEQLADALSQYPSTKDIDDGYTPGKMQLDFRLKPEGRSLGLSSSDVASQIRAAFYGSQAIRQQRGRDEVRVLVKLPEAESRSRYSIEQMMIKTPSGAFVPLRKIADFQWGRAYTSIERRDGRRIVEVEAGVEPRDEVTQIINSLREEVLPQLLRDYPGLSYSFAGAQADIRESLAGLGQGFLLSCFLIYFLLAIPFASYTQPAIVMTALPFGMVGAIIGHWIMGYSLSVISMMGIVALCGVVINDSLIMIAFANDQRRAGLDRFQSMHNAGVRRFRPILLTTMTTFFGLAPMIFETSRQARFMIPMAISLGYGLVFATAITLVLIPSLYLILEDIQDLFARLTGQKRKNPYEQEREEEQLMKEPTLHA